MGKIFLMCGISGGGKSTIAHEIWKEDTKRRVIVSRDSVRKLLFGYSDSNLFEYYNNGKLNSMEKTVSDYVDHLILYTLNSGKDVIVDNTHLKMKYIEHYKKFNANVTLVVVDTDIDVCIHRDVNRSATVGSDIIKRQSRQFKTLMGQIGHTDYLSDVTYIEMHNIKNTMKYEYVDGRIDTYVFDIDGTIADNKGERSPYDMDKVGNDSVIEEVAEILRLLDSNQRHITICTGRDGSGTENTIKWLKDNNIPFDEFYIRKEKDMRPDFIVKEEMWDKISKEFNIVSMFDDRWQVTSHARALGLKVFSVEFNTF